MRIGCIYSGKPTIAFFTLFSLLTLLTLFALSAIFTLVAFIACSLYSSRVPCNTTIGRYFPLVGNWVDAHLRGVSVASIFAVFSIGTVCSISTILAVLAVFAIGPIDSIFTIFAVFTIGSWSAIFTIFSVNSACSHFVAVSIIKPIAINCPIVEAIIGKFYTYNRGISISAILSISAI